ncbi:DUF2285 domain-containing protein [Sphingomonas sp. DT-207]|uniref:DUF2285 domain-containing protein n=1 Tax=Sphingomonas sp. DT-207 TaxID=3396167 RepID=UPI003F1C597A
MWQDVHDPAVVRIDAIASSANHPDSLDLGRTGVRVTAFPVAGGDLQLLLSEGSRHIRLALRSGSLFEGPVRLRYALEGLRDLEPRLLTLRRLAGLWRLGYMPAQLFPRDRRAPRWIAFLRAIDALHAGAAQRDIAVALFGADRVRNEWRGRSDYLRLRVQRLVRSSEMMIRGGYLQLVAERPSVLVTDVDWDEAQPAS